MRKFFLLLLLGLFVFLRLSPITQVFSEDDISALNLDQINSKLSELQNALSASQKATAPLQSQVASLQTQLKGIENRVAAIEADLAQEKKYIDAGEKELEANKDVFNRSVRDYYIKSYFFSPLLVFASSKDAADVTRLIIYQKKGADKDKDTITSLALKLVDLENRKAKLESEEKELASVKDKLDSEKGELEKVVKGAQDYQATLSNQIAQLSARQKEILGQRLGALNIPTTAYTSQGGCSDDRGVDPGFSPRIAFFTYGVPNRVGLNQYGAKGRAEAGQNAQQILSAYYNADYTTGYNTGINIHVVGTNEYGQSFDTNWNIEEYLKHVYEIPATWPAEALKAQAIAARSYALSRTNNGANTICPSQSCQVVKQEQNSQAWIDAVNATSGIVLTSGGNPITAWFSSTHGGYVFSSGDIGWSSTSYTKRATDTTTGSAGSFSDLQSNAYDKGSPWFYCDWGSRASYNKTAWLKPSEVADIVNVIMLAKADSSTNEHLYQTDKSNPAGTDTWNEDRVRQELRSRNITPFTNVSDISVSADFSNGKTNSVNVNGDGGSQSLSADEFKNWFNLRAPANLQIVGPLFNTEKQ
ncbi:MAG TPA: SpoIID/LytB domain-containing protein [Patescibacteria group bacterium]|nr:SpoIID/LytB domain-containing protein [Patescibacteria group bacterium]